MQILNDLTNLKYKKTNGHELIINVGHFNLKSEKTIYGRKYGEALKIDQK